jgi:hypothetical protein
MLRLHCKNQLHFNTGKYEELASPGTLVAEHQIAPGNHGGPSGV